MIILRLIGLSFWIAWIVILDLIVPHRCYKCGKLTFNVVTKHEDYYDQELKIQVCKKCAKQ